MSPNSGENSLELNSDKMDDFNRFRNHPESNEEVIMSHCARFELFANAIFVSGSPQMEEKTSWRIGAIKEILWIHSPVLQKLSPEGSSLLPPQGESRDSLPLYRIAGDDDNKNGVEETTFRDFLKYAYTWNWMAPQGATAESLNSTIGLWKLAKKLEVKSLETKIRQFLQTTLDHFDKDAEMQANLEKNVSKKLNQRNLKTQKKNESLGTLKKMAAPKKEDSIKISQFATLPSELLCKIFRQIPSPELLNFRLISKRIQTIIQDSKEIDLTVIIGEAQLTRTKWLTTSSSSLFCSKTKMIQFRKLVVRLKVFYKNLKNDLLNLLKYLTPTGSTIQMELTIESIPDSRILHSFLHSMSQMRGNDLANRLHLHLVLGTMTCLDYCVFPQPPPNYPQLRSLGLKKVATAKERGCCLLRVLESAPNLKEIFVCDPTARVNPDGGEVLDFLKAANLRNVTVSKFKVTNLPATPSTIRESCVQLKENGLIFRMIHFINCGATEQLEFVKVFCQDLEQIYFAINSNFEQSTFLPLLSSEPGTGVGGNELLIFPKLRLLRLHSDWHKLSNILERTPQLRHLIWCPILSANQKDDDGATAATAASLQKNGEIVFGCPKLTKLSIEFNVDGSEDQLVKFMKGNSSLNYFEKVTTLHCFLMGEQKRLRHFYSLFPNVRTLKIFSKDDDMATENILGLADALTDDGQLRDPLFRERPRYIGNFKKLKILNMGLLDYQKYAEQWMWPLKLTAFTQGICHLSELTEIHFPPLNKEVAEVMLTFLAVNMKQLDRVIFQVWAGTAIDGGVGGKVGEIGGGGAAGAMELEANLTPSHLEELRSIYNSNNGKLPFKILCSPVISSTDGTAYTIM